MENVTTSVHSWCKLVAIGDLYFASGQIRLSQLVCVYSNLYLQLNSFNSDIHVVI